MPPAPKSLIIRSSNTKTFWKALTVCTTQNRKATTVSTPLVTTPKTPPLTAIPTTTTTTPPLTTIPTTTTTNSSRRCPGSRPSDVSLTVMAKLFAKNMKEWRPDYFHFYDPTNMALHGEFDEDNRHEDNHDRLREIAHDAGCGWERTYYFRIMAHIDKPEIALFRKLSNEYGGYYVITPRGLVVLDQVAKYVTECLDRMEAGVMPWEERPRDLPIKWFNK